jgi:hypothetical protein
VSITPKLRWKSNDISRKHGATIPSLSVFFDRGTLLAVFTFWNGGRIILSARLKGYFFKRKAVMPQIEDRDLQQSKTIPRHNEHD